MVDVRGDVLRPPHGTTPAAVKANKTLYLILINLFLILTFMQTLLSHEIVKIPNLFILQPVI